MQPPSHNQIEIGRHEAFLAQKPMDRPLIGSWLIGFSIQELYPEVAETLQPGPVQPEDIPDELFIQDVDTLRLAFEQLNDDYPFSKGPLYGVPWVEAIAGCPITYTGEKLVAHPLADDGEQYQRPATALDSPWGRKLLALLAKLVEHSAGRYDCSPAPMRGLTDVCVAIRGKEALLEDLDHSADEVSRMASYCADLWVEVAKAQLATIPASDRGYVISCGSLRCWMPDKGIWLQDDKAAILPPEAYRKYFLPKVKEIASEFDWVAFHLHPSPAYLLGLILEIEDVAVVELNYDAGVIPLENHFPEWERIQAHKPCLIFGEATLEEIGLMAERLSPTGLSIQSLSQHPQEGRAKFDRVLAGPAR